MSLAALIRSMSAAGAPAEAIALAVEAIEAAQAEVAVKRAAGAERVRRYRERKAAEAHDVTHGNVTVTHNVTPPAPSLTPPVPPLSPCTPYPPLNPPEPTPTPVILRAADAFDQFWKAYPKRTGKEAARKAWAVVAKRGVTPDRIMAGLHRFAEHPPDDPQFIPHPATWLNQGRYDDEPMETRNGNSLGRDQRTPDRQYRRDPAWDGLKRLAAEVEADGW